MKKPRQRDRKLEDQPPKKDPALPSGIGAAAIRGAMQSEQTAADAVAENRESQPDDDQARRRARGKTTKP